METALVQAELPPELKAQAQSFVANGWAKDMDDLVAEALRRFLDSHPADITEAQVLEDVAWGLSGNG